MSSEIKATEAHLGDVRAFVAVMPAVRRGRALLLLALAAGAGHGLCQGNLGEPSPLSSLIVDYVEPGVAACPPVPAAGPTAAEAVKRGLPVPGRVRVTCGLDQGSYTVSLISTDGEATFVPRTFLVNFGRLVGNGVFTVTFSTVGVHSVSGTITSNMGSPAARGQFAGTANAFNVVMP